MIVRFAALLPAILTALLAAGMSVYMLIAIRYEERDLVHLFGRDYEDYRGRVGMLTPRLRRRA